MHRLAVVLVVAACDLVPPPATAPADASIGTSLGASIRAANATVAAAPDAAPRPADATIAVPAAPPGPAPAASHLAITAHPPEGHVSVAAPAQAIRALAVTEDGTTAVSSDTGGAVRVWPALDGTREPVVTALRRPVSLAIERDENNLEIAGIDGAGQLELARVSANGEPAHRASVELARPAIAVHATQNGFLVERDDQHLVLVAPSGTIAGEVEPPPGSHIAAIAVHGGVVVALLDSAGGARVRTLFTLRGLTWDDPSPVMPIAPHGIALSPSHAKIAAVIQTAGATRLALFDRARGRRVLLGPESDFIDPTLEPVGFLDEQTVVVRASGTLELWHATSDDNTVTGFEEMRRASAIAVGGAHAVIGNSAALTLADRSGTLHYLGFRVPGVAMVAGGGYSLLASDGAHVMRLGADLQERASYALPKPHGEAYYTPALLDGTHVLLQGYYARQMVLDLVALDTMQVIPLADESQLLAYDPDQRLAAFREPGAVRFRRFDSKTGRFGKGVELPVDNETSSITFAGGDSAYVTTTYDTTYTVLTVRAIRPERGMLKIAHKRTGELQFDSEGEGFSMPVLPAVGRTVASPDGTLVASYVDGRLTLRDAKGAVRWTVPNGGASELTWLRTGELLAIGGGLARIDVATGAFEDRRCGWEFGLWPEPIDAFASGTLCDAE